MAIFNTVRQGNRLLSKDDITSNYVRAVSELPDPASVQPQDFGNHILFLTEYSRNYVPGRIYKIVEIDGVKQWIDIEITECGKLAPPTGFWKRITSDSIALHWEDPADIVDPADSFKNATWDHDVIIRKYASGPKSIHDGEVVGYSTVRNQYKSGVGFVHGPIDDDDADYYYRVFSVTKGGVATPTTESLRTAWTWPEIHGVVQQGKHKEIFKVGDVFPMPEHTVYGTLHARIVDFDRTSASSITFMIEEVIGCGREGQEENIMFDNKEFEYALTEDVYVKANKTYYDEHLDPFEPSDFDDDNPYTIGATIASMFGNQPVYEKHPATRYYVDQASDVTEKASRTSANCTLCGSNIWSESNLRQWLRTTTVASGSLLSNEFDYSHSENATYTDGWFTSKSRFDIAPSTPDSVHYIDVVPFAAGFVTGTQEEFLQYLVSGYSSTNLNDYNAGRNTNVTDDAVTIDKRSSESIAMDKFWLPSFSEIYGSAATLGANGTTTNQGTEGNIFQYFVGADNTMRLRYGYQSGNPCNWLLRSPDTTTVAKVYYVPGYQVSIDNQQAICLSCNSHRSELELDTFGICPCFHFG